MEFEDTDSKVSVSPTVTTSQKPTPPTKKETKGMMKHLKKGLQANKQVFHTIDLKKYGLGWGFQQTEGARLRPIGEYAMELSTNEPIYRYIYLHTVTKLHYLTINFKKLDDYTTEMEKLGFDVVNNPW